MRLRTETSRPDRPTRISRRRRLLAVDQLCTTIAGTASPFEFRVAHSEKERRVAHRMRFEGHLDQGCPAASLDGPLEIDSYDADGSLNILGWRGGCPIAVTRLVFPQTDRPLPTEASFAIRVEPYLQVVDLSRLYIRPAFRTDPAVFLGLYAVVWSIVRRRGYSRFTGANTSGMIRLYRGMGMDMVKLSGEPQWIFNHWRFPIYLDGASADLRRMRRWLRRGRRAGVTTRAGHDPEHRRADPGVLGDVA